MTASERKPFAVEISRMIEVLAAQIYPSPFALLRENVQNAFDAILIRKQMGQRFRPRIDVVVKPGLVRVTDNGVGMSRVELSNNFWRAGSSSKNTDIARAAGVVGTFGIGAMANFGIAEDLIVTTESAQSAERTRCKASRSTLSVTEECIDFEFLDPTGSPGTEVEALMQPGKSINVDQATTYIVEFVKHLSMDVFVNEIQVSKRPLEESVAELAATWQVQGNALELPPRLRADVLLSGAVSGDVRIDLRNLVFDGKEIAGHVVLRQGIGNIRTFRNGFGLASAAVSSAYNFGGVADLPFLQPTAGREALTTGSIQTLQHLIEPVDNFVSTQLAARPESNVNAYFAQWAARHSRWQLCGHFRVRIEPGEAISLIELEAQSKKRPYLLYTGTDATTIKHASKEKPLVLVARTVPRRDLELQFIRNRCKLEELTDDPKVLKLKKIEEYSLAESALSFRLSSILANDYFLEAQVRFGKISHDLPILVVKRQPAELVLDPDGQSVRLMLDVYEKEFVAFGHMAKDFVRNEVFPKIKDLVPSATRQGAEAFLRSIQRNREVFEYEAADLENLTSLWKDFLGGKLSTRQVVQRERAVAKSFQIIDAANSAPVRDVVPAGLDTDKQNVDVIAPNFSPRPPIERRDVGTDKKLLTVSESEPPFNGYRAFLAITDRVRDERGDFFLQPHKTSIVWGGQKVLFIFEHQAGRFGLYYDIQTKDLVADTSGGGAVQTCTIVMKNRIFIPLPDVLRGSLLPKGSERKRLEVRCDMLYIDQD